MRKRWALAFASLLCALMAGELWVRLLELGPTVYSPRRFEPDGGVPFTTVEAGGQALLLYRPNSRFSSVYDLSGDQRRYFESDGRVTYRINALGLRGDQVTIAEPENGYRVICLGDSITFGEGVREDDTYPARMEDLLSQEMPTRQVEVINAGIQGYGTTEEEKLFASLCVPLNPDAVVLQAFLNDATDFRETIRQNDARTHDMRLSLPGRVSMLWEIVERRRHATSLQSEYFDTTRRSFQSLQWDACRQSLRRMSEAARQHNIRLIVVLFPMLWNLDEHYDFEDLHALIANAAQDAGCEFIDLLEVYRGSPADTLWVHPTDHHPNEIAHEMAAGRIAQELLREK